MNLCQPELSLDAESLNARLTRLEEQIKTGAIVVKQEKNVKPVPEDSDDERPPLPDDSDAPPAENLQESVPKASSQSAAPAGFWTDLMTASRKELKPPASGFFVASQNSPLRGALKGDVLELRCQITFVADTVNRPDILEVVSRKASSMLNRPVRVQLIDMTAKPAGNPRMEQLMKFGRDHSDIIKIKK